MDEKDIVVSEPQRQISLGQMQFATTKEMVTFAKEMSKDLYEIIEAQKLYTVIRDEKYVRVEGWTTLGAMLGVTPRTVSVDEIQEGVFEATVELVRASDGQVIGRGIAECGDSDTWRVRDRYARKSMAITRATGKAYRLAFSWIVTLAGYKPTPAEEMPEAAKEIDPDANPADVLVPFPKAKKMFDGKTPTVAELIEEDADYCQWIITNMDGDIVDAIKAHSEYLLATDIERKEGVINVDPETGEILDDEPTVKKGSIPLSMPTHGKDWDPISAFVTAHPDLSGKDMAQIRKENSDDALLVYEHLKKNYA